MGSNFIKFVLARHPDISVVSFDKLTYAGNLDNLKDVEKDPRYKFVKGDISDRAAVFKLFEEEKPDSLINFAAETHVDRSLMGADDFLRTNVLGTHVLLEAAKNFSITKYIQISTDEVYGSADDGGEFYETTPFKPNSPYSAAKAGGDLLCHAYFNSYKTPVIVTHSCNFVGPNQYPEKFIPLAITNLLEGKKIPIYGDGKQIREWIYTEDFCSAIDTILQKGLIGEVYNLGTRIRKTNLEVAQALISLLGQGEIEYVKDRPGHDRRYAVNSDKIRSQLGWLPAYDFERALKETVQWYKDNEPWWKKIKSGQYQEYYKKQYK